MLISNTLVFLWFWEVLEVLESSGEGGKINFLLFSSKSDLRYRVMTKKSYSEGVKPFKKGIEEDRSKTVRKPV